MCVVGTLTSLVGQFIGHDEISLGQVRFPLVRETSPSQHPAAVTSEAMISPAALRALLAEPDTQKRIRAVVSSRVRSGTPDAVRDDIVQQANLALLQSPSRPRSPKRALAWLSAVTQRQVANYFRARAAEASNVGKMIFAAGVKDMISAVRTLARDLGAEESDVRTNY